jgi:hypothetical protein
MLVVLVVLALIVVLALSPARTRGERARKARPFPLLPVSVVQHDMSV